MQHKRVVVTRYGGPETIEVVEEPIPEPGHGEVRVKVQAAGVAMPDVMAREGIHPETPKTPFTPGWDLVGTVDLLGEDATGFQPGQTVTAMPIHGAYAQYVCLPVSELVPVPDGLDPAEAVSLVLNYITAYQMMHRSARVKGGQGILVHGATGGVGTSLMQLGKLMHLDMLGTCSPANAPVVSEMGGRAIDYNLPDYAAEVRKLTGGGVDAVFDPIAGAHLWQSRQALRPGGRVVGYGNTTTLRSEGLGAGRKGRRNRFHGLPLFGLYIVGSRILPGRRRIVPYSIQTLKRLKPALFREDLATLLGLLRDRKIAPIVARRFPLVEARQAQELLAKGGVTGKIVLVDGSVQSQPSV